MWLYVRLQGAEDERMPEKDRPPAILETGKRIPRHRGVDFDDVEEVLSEHGYEFAPPLTPHTPASEWPVTAIVYTKQDKVSLGRSGSSIHRLAVRKRKGKQ